MVINCQAFCFTRGEIDEFHPLEGVVFILLVAVQEFVAFVAHVGVFLQHSGDQRVAAVECLLVRVAEGFFHVYQKHEAAHGFIQLSMFFRAAMISASVIGLMFFSVMIDL
ncbi:hypothetical protein AALK14_02410 [Butyricimonas hominis]|uniref:hypothetical protein n=1 Tax=Butyricimonas hominis TaxID=2763032 RepID=UPI0035149C43